MMGTQVSNWRKLQRLTAAQVAERAGISRDTLRAIEQGKGTANTENLFRVLRILGVLDGVVAATDPYQTDVGRLRADETLPAGSGTEHPTPGAAHAAGPGLTRHVIDMIVTAFASSPDQVQHLNDTSGPVGLTSLPEHHQHWDAGSTERRAKIVRAKNYGGMRGGRVGRRG